MTSGQTLVVAALGGLFAVIALIVFIALAVGVYMLSSRLTELREQRREERQNLKTCRAIDALGTTNHPKG
ncbi:hypothetical protein [Streptomyces sp. STR69]|uniref:hypothetical protein n=1 Tax=Streptomyces sp. STR69 TaxID=1796942 RepID=UPI0021C7F69E|nr:hypothetical protein [Streptomyces sp. STR69]